MKRVGIVASFVFCFAGLLLPKTASAQQYYGQQYNAPQPYADGYGYDQRPSFNNGYGYSWRDARRQREWRERQERREREWRRREWREHEQRERNRWRGRDGWRY